MGSEGAHLAEEAPMQLEQEQWSPGWNALKTEGFACPYWYALDQLVPPGHTFQLIIILAKLIRREVATHSVQSQLDSVCLPIVFRIRFTNESCGACAGVLGWVFWAGPDEMWPLSPATRGIRYVQLLPREDSEGPTCNGVFYQLRRIRWILADRHYQQ